MLEIDCYYTCYQLWIMKRSVLADVRFFSNSKEQRLRNNRPRKLFEDLNSLPIVSSRETDVQPWYIPRPKDLLI